MHRDALKKASGCNKNSLHDGRLSPSCRHHLSLIPVIIDGTYLSSYKALRYLKKEHKMGEKNSQGLTGLTVNTPKMDTSPYSHIKISIYIFIII